MQSRRSVIPEASVITDFAITSVDVPDRLDAQELRDRTEADESRPDRRRRSHAAWRWALRVSIAFAVVVAIVAAFRSLSLVWTHITPESVASRLTRELGVPVSVANASLSFAPSPRLVIEGIRAGDLFPLGTATLRFDWGSLPRIVRGGDWAWGEVTVAPLELSVAQAWALIDAVPKLSAAVPPSIGSVTFEGVRVRDAALLPGRYRVVAERSARGGPFNRLVIEAQESDGRLGADIELGWGRPSAFRLRASRWRPPIGPDHAWNDVSAEGSFADRQLHIETFSANSFLGVVTGSLDAVQSSGWVAHGAISATDIDLTAVQRELRRRVGIPGTPGDSPLLQGVMSAEGTLSGSGATLARAIDALAVSGRATVRFAALNGIDLGALALQMRAGQQRAGSTKFSEFETRYSVSRGTIRLHDIVATAGALQIHGSVGIDRNLVLGGVLRTEVARPAGAAPNDVRVAGTLFDPVFDY